jgi:hypothetical protein
MSENTTTENTPGGGLSSTGLLACPFCGKAPNLTQIGNYHTPKRGIRIKCTTIGCVEFNVCVIRNTLEWADQKAREKWNTRIIDANDN